MLLAVFPLSVIDTAISPGEHTVTFTLIILEVSFVLFAVFPFEKTSAMHFVLLPHAFVGLTIGPDILSAA